VEELKKLKLDVARRTVTKYRQKLNIPSSRQRRDWTKNGSNGASAAVHRDDEAAEANKAEPELETQP
jgi:hypothetical protein